MKLKFKRLTSDAIVPKYASSGVVVTQATPQAFGTGLAVEIPLGWSMKIHSRSGHGFNHDIRLANCTAIIDSGYRGEIRIKLASDGGPYTVRNGDRIAQAELVRSEQIEFEEVSELSSSERGSGGFGHTGTGIA